MEVLMGKELQVNTNFPQLLLHCLLVSISIYNLSVNLKIASLYKILSDVFKSLPV